MKKKMTKKMKDVVPDEEGDDEEGNDEEHDVNDVETPGDEDHEEDHDEEDGEEGDEDHEEDHDEEDGEEAKDMAKYGFMKDKKDKKDKKKAKKKKDDVNESSFWKSLDNYHVPRNSDETDTEFFESLARQYGKPEQERYSGGLIGDGINEYLLLSADQ